MPPALGLGRSDGVCNSRRLQSRPAPASSACRSAWSARHLPARPSRQCCSGKYRRYWSPSPWVITSPVLSMPLSQACPWSASRSWWWRSPGAGSPAWSPSSCTPAPPAGHSGPAAVAVLTMLPAVASAAVTTQCRCRSARRSPGATLGQVMFAGVILLPLTVTLLATLALVLAPALPCRAVSPTPTVPGTVFVRHTHTHTHTQYSGQCLGCGLARLRRRGHRRRNTPTVPAKALPTHPAGRSRGVHDVPCGSRPPPSPHRCRSRTLRSRPARHAPGR